MKTFAEKVIAFNHKLNFTGNLPEGISIMNPFRENENVLKLSAAFYKKYYHDHERRHLILGINPGRFGSAVTGVPFTDTKRLVSECEIPCSGKQTHEPSSVFVYEVIKAYGGLSRFYKDFYIHSVCPLGFTMTNTKGREVNYNYYDNRELTTAVRDFIIENIRQQIALGIFTDTCLCFGNGKNEKFLRMLNERFKFFKHIVALEHPRFVMQYRSKTKQVYIDKYVKTFKNVTGSE